MLCSWTHLPSSHATMLAHAFNTLTKESLATPVFCICQNKCLLPLSTFHTSPSKSEFVRTHSFSLHLLEKLHCLVRLPMLRTYCKLFYSMQKCSIALCLVPLRPSLLPLMVSSVGPQARVLPVSSYVWNAGTFHLSITRDPEDQADQTCLLHIWGINGIIRTDKSCNDLLHWQENFVTTYCILLTILSSPVV
jgi:hypothetical protein